MATGAISMQIYIDGEPITVRRRRLTGTELAALVSPPADNVWLDIPDAQDHPVAPTHVVVLEDGMRFFTDRPRTIYIDKTPYQVRTATLTEAQLRALPTPPVPEDCGIWKDVPDDLDDPIKSGELVAVVDGDRFFTKQLPKRELHVTVNRTHTVILHGARHTGASIKQAAIAQGVPIQMDFLLSRKAGAKFTPIGDEDFIRIDEGDEFRAIDGDDNS